MIRRTFLKTAAMGAASLAGAGALKARGERASKTSPVPIEKGDSKIGRPVRIASIGYAIENPPPLKTVAEHVDAEGAKGVDVIILPETCQGQNKTSAEPLLGPTVTAMAELASKHKTYIAVPIDCLENNRRLNSLVFLDRNGQIACIYNKVFPYWSEYDLDPPVSPGEATVVHTADFGRVGFATCFDVNFPEVWKKLADQGTELVLWPSAYSAGRSLQAHAVNHHYYIVTSTQMSDCMVYDITGEEMLRQADTGLNITRVTLDLDRGIYHENFNIAKRDQLLREHGDDVMQEKSLTLEEWFVLKAKRPGVSARELARQYGLEELRHYIDRSRSGIDERRGWKFAEKS
jgi:predicted amidohydrolase